MGTCFSCCKQAPETKYISETVTNNLNQTHVILHKAKSFDNPVSEQSKIVPLISSKVSANSDFKSISHVPSKSDVTLVKRQLSKNMDIFNPYPKLPAINKESSGCHSESNTECSDNKILQMFLSYKDSNSEDILAEGIERFCYDLELSPDDFYVLLIAWKFSALTMCRFSKEEFINGCKKLNADSIQAIQNKLPELYEEIQNKNTYRDFYRWTYKFGLDYEIGQRTLPIDMAITLWRLVFTSRKPSILDQWIEFLNKNPGIRGIPRDTWDMFLHFVETVKPDLSCYDDTEAWPSLFDDFVEAENDRENQNFKHDVKDSTESTSEKS